MPLSEHEQRLLEQMERALYSEDPKFASSLRDGGPHRANRRTLVLGAVATLGGVGLLLGGVATQIIPLGVVGFLAMLGGTLLVLRSFRSQPAAATGTAPAAGAGTPGAPAGAAAPKPARQPRNKAGFMDRVEERWRRRREGDGGGL